MNRKLIIVLSALVVSVATLTGCVYDDGYRYYDVAPATAYRDQVGLERRDYYVAPRARYHRKAPQHVFYLARDHRSPRCFGTNCYVGTTYREDPYYRLSE